MENKKEYKPEGQQGSSNQQQGTQQRPEQKEQQQQQGTKQCTQQGQQQGAQHRPQQGPWQQQGAQQRSQQGQQQQQQGTKQRLQQGQQPEAQKRPQQGLWQQQGAQHRPQQGPWQQQGSQSRQMQQEQKFHHEQSRSRDQPKQSWSQGQQRSQRQEQSQMQQQPLEQQQQQRSEIQPRPWQQYPQDKQKQGWAQGYQQRPQQQQEQQFSSQGQQQKQTRMTERSSSATSSQISGAALSKSGIPRGTIGRPKIVETNFLRLNLEKMPSIAYQYDVTITPDRPKKSFRQAFEQLNSQYFPNIGIAFDGNKNCYTVQPLDIGNGYEREVTINDSYNRTLTYKITLKATDSIEIDLNQLRTYFRERIWEKPMRAMQCLEVVLASPCHNKGIRTGRSFFTRPNETIDLDDGYELYIGLYQALILGEEPFLNVDIAHKSFPKPTTILNYLHSTIRNFDSTRQLQARDVDNLAGFLSGLRITYKAPNTLSRQYNFLKVSEDSAARRTFLFQESKTMTIADYFQNERKIRLRYPNLNCLIVGSTAKSIALPIEFCEIESGQAIRRKDGSRQVQKMIRYAATSTNDRKRKIMNLLHRFEHNTSQLITQFGINFDPTFIDVPIRVLNPPNIEYFRGEIQKVFNGSWRMNPNTKFLETKEKTHKWAIIYSKDSRNLKYTTLTKLADTLKRAAEMVSLELEPRPYIDVFVDIDSKLLEMKKIAYDLVIVVIPFRGVTYSKIKQSAELRHGILTQCIKEETVERRCNSQTAGNIMLKINAKLNGTNHKIDARSQVPIKNVMFLGADVTHPSPDQTRIPSVVGVAASHDENGACYNMQYRLQTSTQEEIEDMASIIKHHLSVYFRHLKKYPDHIIYYRDGVSDGQFEKVRNLELRSMQAAFATLKINPKITCIIAVKRHHTRFFPKDVNPRDKFNNVEPGTVVDRTIIHPSEVQFFMVSHQSIQGTAKPTLYNVIQDDAKMDINNLQALTHNLCHLFPRCNRTVSYPTPVYLAHLVACRGRVYLDGPPRYGDPKDEYKKRQIHSEFMQNNPMYFV